ncbi:phospholipase/Carboxylesterase [Kribbella flavida DSM 17836]|uniref:Phospholipase/Carboxylesterase n=1 Tax=Kribbella flavida (strain DSM 17836 / JCM 10339 / NBRC 14399) TaxID=479435 RepID=D2PQJ8_KRIFD|nr:alpha/beta hydrolase [Kribbella flavida]ADB29185.1 phospholipase/Carboxylesterase [Kribbella flavida DSM 17836]
MHTAEDRYDALTDEVAALYELGRQADALALMDATAAELGDQLTPWAAELAHLRACLLGSLGNAEAALEVLVRASDAGGWWEESILTEDDDLAGLRTLPGFDALVANSRARRTPGITPPLIRLPPDGRTVVRVVVALHGAGQTARHAARDWASVLDLGCALVCVESSQLMSPRYRTWPDPAAAADDIARALAELPAELDGLPLVAAGFSAGGRVAISWALTATPQPVAGVIALAPALRELPTEAATSLAPASVLIGTDDDLLEVVLEAADQLEGFGLRITTLPGQGHQVPSDFADLLAQTLGT